MEKVNRAKSITKAYIILLSIFGVVLIIGSLKSTLYPDETIYAAGQIIKMYHPDQRSFVQVYPKDSKLDFDYLKADIFEEDKSSDNSNDCLNPHEKN